MRIVSRMAGIALQDGEIRIALARRKYRGWYFEDFIALTLPETESAENGVSGLSVVATALTKWRKRIPGRPVCRAALCCLHDTVLLPEAWQPECRCYDNAETDDVPPGYAAAAGMVLCGEDRL